MTTRTILTAAAACLVLAACSKGEAPPAAEVSGDAAASQAADAAVKSNEIPAGMQGRWGLVAADCTSTSGDAKGLLEIGPMNLKFYESIARLTKVAEDTRDHIKATFAYSGEGMDWMRDATLDLKDSGKTLVLEEYGKDAVPGPRNYTRCP